MNDPVFPGASVEGVVMPFISLTLGPQPMIEGSGVIDGDDMRSGWGWEEVILPAWIQVLTLSTAYDCHIHPAP